LACNQGGKWLKSDQNGMAGLNIAWDESGAAGGAALRKRNYAWQAENLPQLYRLTPFKLSKPE